MQIYIPLSPVARIACVVRLVLSGAFYIALSIDMDGLSIPSRFPVTLLNGLCRTINFNSQ